MQDTVVEVANSDDRSAAMLLVHEVRNQHAGGADAGNHSDRVGSGAGTNASRAVTP